MTTFSLLLFYAQRYFQLPISIIFMCHSTTMDASIDRSSTSVISYREYFTPIWFFFELNECQDFFPIHLFLAYKTRTHVRTGSVVFGSIRPAFALIKFEKGKYAVRISHFGTAHGSNEAQTHRFSPPFWENFGYFIIRRKFIISMNWCPCRQPVPL